MQGAPVPLAAGRLSLGHALERQYHRLETNVITLLQDGNREASILVPVVIFLKDNLGAGGKWLAVAGLRLLSQMPKLMNCDDFVE